MKKSEMVIGTEYALWLGRGRFAVPKRQEAANEALEQTARVKLLRRECPASESGKFLIAPDKRVGLLFVELDKFTGEELTGEDGERVTHWDSNALKVAGVWTEVEALIAPVVEKYQKMRARRAALERIEKDAAAFLADRLGKEPDDINVDLREHESRNWRGEPTGDWWRYVSVSVNFETFEEIIDYIGSKEVL